MRVSVEEAVDVDLSVQQNRCINSFVSSVQFYGLTTSFQQPPPGTYEEGQASREKKNT